MKRKLNIRAILVFIIILLIACDGENDNSIEEEYTQDFQDEVIQSVEDEAISEVDEIEAIATYEEYPEQGYIYDINDTSFSEWGSFGDGLAWVYYHNSATEIDKWIALDKYGIAQFYIEGERTTRPERFDNGYTHFLRENGSHYKIVDTEGNITHYTAGRNVLAHGQGYTVILEHVSGFDDNYYIYTVYDPYGSEVDSAQWEEDRINIEFGGERIFNFMNFMTGTLWLFNIENVEWINTGFVPYFGEKQAIDFYEDWTVLAVRTGGAETNWHSTLKLININGENQQTLLPREETNGGVNGGNWSIDSAILADGIVVISDLNGWLVTYDIQADTFYIIDDEWSERFDRDYDLTLNNELITAHVRGDDRLTYVVVFDKEWNVITEPILSSGFWGFSYERLVVRTMRNDNYLGLVLNEEGQEVFTFDIQNQNIGWNNMTSYFEEILRVIDDYNVRYYDLEGNVLFTEIDISNFN